MNNNRSRSSRYIRAGRVLLMSLVAMICVGIATAQDSFRLTFKDAIGVIPVTGVNANGASNLNVIRGVSPGAPWRIADFRAVVTPDGHIRVVGRGLLLASGNGIGTNAAQRVHATLFCGPAATATSHSSNAAGVALRPDGDFSINDYLSPAPPAPCETPVLLIRNVGGVWFAAGIPRTEGYED